MAGLLDLFSGRSSDIYGQGLLTPEQRGGLGNIGLLALAGKLGQLAGPSFSPVPDFGAALGQAAGAYGASQEGAGTAALNAILTGQKGRKLEQELDYYKQLGPILGKLAGQGPGADGGAGGGEGSGSTGGGAAAPAGAGGGGGGTGGWGPHAETAADVFRKAGWSEAAIQGALANGLAEGGFSDPWRKAGGGENSYGHWQLNAGGELPGFQKFAGDSTDTAQQAAYVVQRLNQIAPGYGQIQDPKAATDIFATKFERYAGAAPGQRYGQLATVQQKLGAPTAAAPAGGGGLLAPNPLSDAEPMVGIPRPAVAPQAAAGPLAISPGTGPEEALTLSRMAPQARSVEARQAQLQLQNAYADALQQGFRGTIQDFVASRGTSGGGGPLAAPPGAGTDSYVTPQGPAGDVGQAGPAGPATPRAPLPTMGPAGIELPPMQGPLAAPAPAAPGPGLLSPPGALPAAPALPRVNPAYDAYARQLAIAAGLVKGAGLPDALTPLLEAFKGSPGYRAQQIIAEKGAAQPFEQAQTLFNKQVEIAGVGPIEAAKLPYALAQTFFKAEQDLRIAGPVAAAQNFERIRADNAAKAIITTRDADGNIKLAIDPDALDAVTRATITAPRQAEANIARETTRIQQEQQAALDLAKQREQVGSIDPIKARNEVLAGEYKETVSAADAASKAKVPLTQIENAMPDFRTGQTAQTRLTLAKTWQDFASNIGLPPNSDLARLIASGEIINKSGTTLGFELARTLGSREAQNIVQQAVAANPGLAVSPGGNKELIGLIKQGLQRDIDKREFFDNHFRQYGSYDRAATEFNRINPVEKYVSQILPYTVATPADAAKLPPGTRFKSPNDPSGLVRTVPER